jgi:hypothetical protein
MAGAGAETSSKEVVPVSVKEKVLVALTVFCFTEAIRLFLHNLLPVAVKLLMGF